MKNSIRRYPRALTLTAMHLIAAAGALAGSDFNGDGIRDLAIGVPNESVGNLSQAGIVQVFYGSAASGIQLTAPADQVWHQDVSGVNQTAEAQDHFGAALATGDFNGDGFDDLAIGTPEEDIVTNGVTVDQAGVVQILYGSASGLTASGDQDWLQGEEGLGGAIETQDRYGKVLCTGDFNGDSFCDLAIGVPDEDVSDVFGAGAVHIIYGSASGLTATGNRFIHQDSTGILDACENQDGFGASLASTDFGNDGFDDLAIGVPLEDTVVNNINRSNTGMVQVIYGTASGLTDIDQVWNQGVNGLLGSSSANEQFGRVLAAGRKGFGGKGNPEQAFLAISVPGDSDSPLGTGSVAILRGNMTSDRLTSTSNRLVTLDVVPGFGAPQSGDSFGASLAIADFGRNDIGGSLDLAVGAPGVTPIDPNNGAPLADNSGAVFVIYDMGGEVNPDKVERWAQGTSFGLADAAEANDAFGSVMVAGNFGRSTFADLVVGIPNEDTNIGNVGAVHLIYAGLNSAGLDAANNQFFTQNTANVEDQAETSDNFGATLGR